MGVVKKLFGGSKPKTPRIVQAPAASSQSTGPSAADIAAQEEEEKKRRIVALNAGGIPGQLTPAGGVQGAATVSRKALLGL